MAGADEEGKSMDTDEEARTALATSIREFGDLGMGWDGEEAAVPSAKAIADALVFVESMPFVGDAVATLHVDGTVMLELEGGGAFRFYGDRGLRIASRHTNETVDAEDEAPAGDETSATISNPRQGRPS
jgi:hypothetical protein